MLLRVASCWLVVVACGQVSAAWGQALGEPDLGQPGDQPIQDYLRRASQRIESGFTADLASLENWNAARAKYLEEYNYMLGLAPWPERTPLDATITGQLSGDGYEVDLLHYQSRPGLYVTGNLYRPAPPPPQGERLPAVFYVCGHSGRGRNGNKTAFASHGIWFARHGYVCLVVDTLQLGEIAATHHGTYRENRWWWHSRGYTPAGVECWNGIRGLDYLCGREDVDPQRLAVTGISGGGASTFWIAAADERVRVAVPVSGMADLAAYVPDRVINGHCDCMFLYNTFEWPWTRIAALVAPRPLLFVNSDQDAIFPMTANERISDQLERLYALHGAGDQFDAVVSIGGHDYRQDIRQSVYRFLNSHLQGDARPVNDSELDLNEESRSRVVQPIEPERLRVFPTDADLPRDELNTTIDQHFVPVAQVNVPKPQEFASWRAALLEELRRVTFRNLPQPSPASEAAGKGELTSGEQPITANGLPLVLEMLPLLTRGARIGRILLWVATADSGQAEPEQGAGAAGSPQRPSAETAESTALPAWLEAERQPDDAIYRCEPRGTGRSRWTVTNPPNYVARAHVLLGRTVDSGRVLDVLAATRRLRELHPGVPITVVGEGSAAVLAIYAGVWDGEVAGVLAHRPPATHMDSTAPVFLNVLRVADIPEICGLLAPRTLTIESNEAAFEKTAAIYAAAGASASLRRIESTASKADR